MNAPFATLQLAHVTKDSTDVNKVLTSSDY